MKTRLTALIVSLVAILSIGGVTTPAMAQTATTSQLVSSEQRQKEIEAEVRFIFEEASSYENGVVTVHEAKLERAYGKDMAAYVAEGIRLLYTDDNLAQEILVNSQNKDFWECMKGELLGLIPGYDIYQLISSGDLKGYIEGKAWGKVAELLGEQFIKLGIKDNVAGVVASITVGAGKCVITD